MGATNTATSTFIIAQNRGKMSDVVILWNADKGDVLSRFARSLSNVTGWPILRKPDPKAAINYFFLYIQIGQNPNVVKGLNKTASLFSHLEFEIPEKVVWWETARERVDIRLTWADMYYQQLIPFGETHIVTPPVDTQFRQSIPRIGVSGFVHKGGRKGEKLVQQLAKEYGGRYKIVASGGGWPLESRDVKEYEWKAMPDFYKSLDVLLVTSLTEGIPMPPLEALSMGKPVVVPSGVGLLDDLSGPLVYRYQAGDYQDMKLALDEALNRGKDSVAGFTEEAWAESHRIAFGLTAGAPIVSNLAPRENARNRAKEPIKTPAPAKPLHIPTIPASGAVVVAYGKPARECAMIALSSWKTHMPEYPVALVSDAPLGIEDIFIEHPDTDIGARSVKTQLYDLTPPEWENVLYLDADTEIVAPVPVLFQWLADGWQFLICTNPQQYISILKGVRSDNREELDATIEEIGSGELIQKNGGVFGFHRGDNSAAFMRGWWEEWKRWKGRDQFALLRALHKNPLKLLLLGQEFNTIIRFTSPEKTAGILHYALRARRWAGIIHGPLDSPEAWKRVIE